MITGDYSLLDVLHLCTAGRDIKFFKRLSFVSLGQLRIAYTMRNFLLMTDDHLRVASEELQ